MLMYKKPHRTGSVLEALGVEVSGDEVVHFMAVGSDYTNGDFQMVGGFLINPDFSLLRIRTTGGQEFGSVTILNGTVDGMGLTNQGRSDRQAATLADSVPYAGYLREALAIGCGDPLAIPTIECWKPHPLAMPDHFYIEIEGWGSVAPPAVSDTKRYVAAQFEGPTVDPFQDYVRRWGIRTNQGLVAYLCLKGDSTMDWYYAGVGTIPPDTDGRWWFHLLPTGAVIPNGINLISAPIQDNSTSCTPPF